MTCAGDLRTWSAQPCGAPVCPRGAARSCDVALRAVLMLRRPLVGLAVAALGRVPTDGEFPVLLAAGCLRSGTCGSMFPMRLQ